MYVIKILYDIFQIYLFQFLCLDLLHIMYDRYVFNIEFIIIISVAETEINCKIKMFLLKENIL